MGEILTYSGYDGDLVRDLKIPGPVMSGIIEYNAFKVDLIPFGYTPVQSGTLRFMGNATSSLISDQNVVIDSQVLSFAISTLTTKPSYEEYGPDQYFTIEVTNSLSNSVIFFYKTIVVEP